MNKFVIKDDFLWSLKHSPSWGRMSQWFWYSLRWKKKKKSKKKKRFFLFPVATFVYISVEVIWGQMCKSMGCLRMQSYQPHRVLWGLVEMQFSIDNCSWWRQGTVKGHRRTLLASVSGISWETTMQNGHAASCQPLLGQLVKTQVTQRSTRQCIWKGRA